MPTYEYQCDPEEGCGYKFEEIQKMSDEPKKKCPNCKKNKLKRLISRTGVIFKGSGWTPKSGSEI